MNKASNHVLPLRVRYLLQLLLFSNLEKFKGNEQGWQLLEQEGGERKQWLWEAFQLPYKSLGLASYSVLECAG